MEIDSLKETEQDEFIKILNFEPLLKKFDKIKSQVTLDDFRKTMFKMID